jgi:predicted RNA binding protein YcfA (HicA-like mRNA interferase family)
VGQWSGGKQDRLFAYRLNRDPRTAMKIREAIRMIERDGWRLVNQEGSHRQYKHPKKKGRVTIAGHFSMDLDPKTQNSILRQAGLK